MMQKETMLRELRERRQLTLKQAEEHLYAWGLAEISKVANNSMFHAVEAAKEVAAYDVLINLLEQPLAVSETTSNGMSTLGVFPTVSCCMAKYSYRASS